MGVAVDVSAALNQFGGVELIILFIILALLIVFGPTKLPEFARAVGRAWGEFRRGKMQVERELRQEMDQGEGEIVASRDQVLRAAREFGTPVEGRDVRDIRLEIAREIDHADPRKVVAVAKALGIAVEGVDAQKLKEQIIRRLQV